MEIIIIDDGSKDNTGKIANEYARKFPDIVRVIHQENGGHGEGINQGLKHATGTDLRRPAPHPQPRFPQISGRS